MSFLHRIVNIILGSLMLALGVVLAMFPKLGIYVVALVLLLGLFAYGFKLLFYYFTMARYMVSGKSSLVQGIIILDVGLFTASLITTGRTVTVIYLLAVFLFYGVIDILRAVEKKHVGAQWRLKLASGIVKVLLALGLTAAGLIFRSESIPVYGYCVVLAYSAAERLVSAFRKQSIVYIQ